MMRPYTAVLILGISVAIFSGPLYVHAAAPLFLTTWKSDNYVPDWFGGKVFPVNKSSVTVSFELISQSSADFGKIVDLSNSDIRWYLNDDYVTDGNGLKSATFTYPQTGGDAAVKISVNYFDPDSQSSSFINYYLTVPRAVPEIVFDNKNFGNAVYANSTLNITAYPFFFNIPDDSLKISWDVNGQQPNPDSNSPLALAVKLGSILPSSGLKISLSLSNPADIFENSINSLFFKTSQ